MNRTDPDSQKAIRSAPRQLRGPFTRWPHTADTALAIVVFLASAFVTFEGPKDEPAIRAVGDVPIAVYILFAVASGALIWRRYKPLVVLGVTLVASILSWGLCDAHCHVFAMMFSLYSVGRYATNDQWSYYGVGATLALAGIGDFINGKTIADIGGALLIVFLVWYMGRRIRIRGDYLRLLEERAEHLEREQASEASRAVAEERTRIARELHDVVAHKVSLMTVQAGAAKTVAADDPKGASRAMEAVEKAGRQALDELRHLMGILRPETDVDGIGPQPGLADIPRLIEQLREAGLDISLTMDGVQTDLPARLDLSTYRIVQEALTNVLKHAGPNARTDVRLSTKNHRIGIEVLDQGQGATILPGTGHGIAGMRERVQLLGGSFEAGPRPDGGFQVVAHLPIGEEPR